MGTLWIPGAERMTPSAPGGEITSSAEPRVVWHSTQNPSGDPDQMTTVIRILREKSAEPQVIWDPITDQLVQFMPLDVSGRALRNDTDGFRNNRCGKVCIQVEVIAYSQNPFTKYWKPGPNYRALMAAIRSWGIPDVQPAGAFPVFIADPPHNVPEDDRDRATWRAKGGHYSHSQIPGNTHGDPGGVSFPAMLAAAQRPVTDTPTAPEDDMPYTETQLEQFAGVGVHGQKLGRSDTTIGVAIDTTYKNSNAIRAQLTALSTQVAGLSAAVKALAEAKDIDPAAIIAAVQTATEQAMSDLKITLSVDNTPET